MNVNVKAGKDNNLGNAVIGGLYGKNDGVRINVLDFQADRTTDYAWRQKGVVRRMDNCINIHYFVDVVDEDVGNGRDNIDIVIPNWSNNVRQNDDGNDENITEDDEILGQAFDKAVRNVTLYSTIKDCTDGKVPD